MGMMRQRRNFILPLTAMVFAVLLIRLRNHPSSLWVAMTGLLAGAVWAAYEARQSWVARKARAGPSRLRSTLDFTRYIFALVCVLGLMAIGITKRMGGASPQLIVIAAALFVVAYLATIVIQIRLGYWRHPQRKTNSR